MATDDIGIELEPAWNYQPGYVPGYAGPDHPERPPVPRKPPVPKVFKSHGAAEVALREWVGPYWTLVPQVRMKHPDEGFKWIDYVAVAPDKDSSLPAVGIEVKPRFTRGPDGIDAFQQCLMYRRAIISDDRPGISCLIGARLKYVLIWPVLTWGGVTDWFNGGRSFATHLEYRHSGEIKMLTDVMGRFNVGQIAIDWRLPWITENGRATLGDTWEREVRFFVGEQAIWTNQGHERIKAINSHWRDDRGFQGLP